MKQKKGRSAVSGRKTGAPKRLPKLLSTPEKGRRAANASTQTTKTTPKPKSAKAKSKTITENPEPVRQAAKPPAKKTVTIKEVLSTTKAKAVSSAKPPAKVKKAEPIKKAATKIFPTSEKIAARKPRAQSAVRAKPTSTTWVAHVSETLKPAATDLEHKPVASKPRRVLKPTKAELPKTKSKTTAAVKKAAEKFALPKKTTTRKPGAKSPVPAKPTSTTWVADVSEALKPSATGLEHKPVASKPRRTPEPPKSEPRPKPKKTTEPEKAPQPRAAEPTSDRSQPTEKTKPGPSLPPILLEGDELGSAAAMLQPETTSLAEQSGDFGSLPCAGAGKLIVIPRDPRTLYVAWDLTDIQQRLANAKSGIGHMALLIWKNGLGRQLVAQIQVHPESRHWFAHVPAPGEMYSAELGYYDADENWCTLATSTTVRAPGGRPPISPQPREYKVAEVRSPAPATQRQADLPAQPQKTAPPLIQNPHREGETASLASAPQTRGPEATQIGAPSIAAPVFPPAASPKEAFHADPAQVSAPRTAPTPQLFQPPEQAPSQWTAENSRQILELSGAALEPTVIGSVELLELISWISRKEGEVSSLEMAEAPAPMPAAEAPFLPGVSSEEHIAPPEQPPLPRKFWFQVNAELIVYGATEPDAIVTIGGRRIRLREDGSFSYRFALPDGSYQLPVIAESRDQDVREARLEFARKTSVTGKVGVHPQDTSLKVPSPESIS